MRIKYHSSKYWSDKVLYLLYCCLQRFHDWKIPCQRFFRQFGNTNEIKHFRFVLRAVSFFFSTASAARGHKSKLKFMKWANRCNEAKRTCYLSPGWKINERRNRNVDFSCIGRSRASRGRRPRFGRLQRPSNNSYIAHCLQFIANA